MMPISPANYGDRARIGMLLPSVNRAAEPQISVMLPQGVSLHTTRLRLQSSKEKHIKEYMKIMGLSETAYFASWIFHYNIIFIILGLVLTWEM